MPACRILRFARTSRWAMVGSGIRNEAAISAVGSPHTERSVSGTRTAGSRAGWQQARIRPSLSSAVDAGSPAPGSHPGAMSAGHAAPARPAAPAAAQPSAPSCMAAASFSARRLSRRSRSVALCRATPASQARGWSGTPPAGHWARAAAQASCTASSAISRSPTWRATIATAAHQWARKTSSYGSLSPAPPGRGSAPPAVPPPTR